MKVSPNFDGFEHTFELTVFVKDELKVGTDIVKIPALQSKYPYHAPIKPIVYSYVIACHIKRWYEIESYGAYKQVDSRSAADKSAAKILDSFTVRDGSRYLVGMLWAEDSIILPDNYYSSLVQLKSLEKRLAKDPHYRNQYSKTIEDDLSKGYVIEVPPHSFSNRSIRVWYLSHHPVVIPNKPGKVRHVLNEASKLDGTSLNKSLLVGPDILQNLVLVVPRFCQHHFAVSVDFGGMFLQVGVPLEDQSSLRFLWRGDPTADVVAH